MTYINITNDNDEEFMMEEDTQTLEIYPWTIINIREVASHIAYQLFDAEYDITQEIIDEEINDYFSFLHENILELTIQKLEENGRDEII